MKATRALHVGLRAALRSPTNQSSTNLAAIQAEFQRQASWFEADWGGRSKTPNEDIMSWVLGSINAVAPFNADGPSAFPKNARALDVACGTGVFTRALAPVCGSVIGIDATEAMLGQARAVEERFDGAEDTPRPEQYICGDAMALPFDSGTFDVVGTRLAVHHFPDPLPIVREMSRVCAPGGLVVIVDLVSDDDPVAAAEHNRLEILRDPTHTTSLSVAGLEELLKDAGSLDVLTPAADASARRLQNVMDLEGWMESTQTSADAQQKIIQAIEAELSGGATSGMHPFRDEDSRLCFTHQYITMIARKV